MLVSPGSKVKSLLVIPPKSLEPAVPAFVLILKQKSRVFIDKINGKSDQCNRMYEPKFGFSSQCFIKSDPNNVVPECGNYVHSVRGTSLQFYIYISTKQELSLPHSHRHS